MATVREQLMEHLENGEDWEKMETPIQGVYVVKIPKTKMRKAMLHLEINPLNEYGKPMKRKGLFIRSEEILIHFMKVLTEDKLYQLMRILDNINKKKHYQLKEYNGLMATVREQLMEHLENGEDWEKMETPIQGVYVVKIPKTKMRKAMLHLEINPLNEYGKPLKRKGLFISSREMLLSFTEALVDDKSNQLIRILDKINKKEYHQLKEYIDVVEEKKEEVRDIVEDEKKEQGEAEKEVEPEKEIGLEKEVGISSKKKSKNGERLYVDLANILYTDRDINDNLKVKNIRKIYQILKLRRYEPILIADATIMHKVDDKMTYTKLIAEKIVSVAPAGRKADIFILKMAQKYNCEFLSNDLFRDYYDKFGKNWINEHRVTYMFEDEELIID